MERGEFYKRLKIAGMVSFIPFVLSRTAGWLSPGSVSRKKICTGFLCFCDNYQHRAACRYNRNSQDYKINLQDREWSPQALSHGG